MKKITIYPKTSRLPIIAKIQITEKMDGTNIGIGKINGNLTVFSRNYMFDEQDIKDNNFLNKPLYEFISKNYNILKSSILDNSIVFGEFLGTGKIKYPSFNKQFYIFAKAKINDSYEITNLNYNLELIHYVFEGGIIPDILERVPNVNHNLINVNKESLDELYNQYTDKVNRQVEGFILLFV